jgi:ABC-type dipeptide/oligopeptide/nickel transport system permease component
MGRYVAVRLFHGVIVIFLISLLTFVVMRMMPGDPVYLLPDTLDGRRLPQNLSHAKSPPYQRFILLDKLALLGGVANQDFQSGQV